MFDRTATFAKGFTMKSIHFFTFAMLLCGALAVSVFAGEHTGHFRHVVCFKFKDGTPEAKVKEIEESFAALKSKIDTLIDFEWGHSDSVEGLNDGFTHCFVGTFKDKAGLEAYLPHPAHQEFVAMLKPHLDKVFVIDYQAK